MGIASAVGHLFESIAELIQGFFAFVLNIFQFGINGVLEIFQFIVNGVMSVFSGFVNFVEGTLGFAFRKSTFLPCFHNDKPASWVLLPVFILS